jgi:hypothetical protein
VVLVEVAAQVDQDYCQMEKDMQVSKTPDQVVGVDGEILKMEQEILEATVVPE